LENPVTDDAMRAEANAVGSALARWVEVQISSGVSGKIMASALIGIGADMIRQSEGDAACAKILLALARDFAPPSKPMH
jgi:hypothetical protein